MEEGPERSLAQDMTKNETPPPAPMREVKIYLPGNFGVVCFNPVTSFIGFVGLWALAIWCMVTPDDALSKMSTWKSTVTLYFTWLYIGSRPAMLFFLIWLTFKYGHVRLGPQDSKPEFSNVAYFSMLFSCGVAVGLFFFGVDEPLSFLSTTYFSNQEYRTEDEVSQNAISYAIYHWGLAAWAGYIVPAIAAGLVSFKYGYPMTFRSLFYPIFGEYTWGWLGDFIDGYSIITTVAGICTSLGLGAIQITAGLQRLGAVDMNISEKDATNIQVTLIAVMTLVATISVLSGLNVGIKYLSILGFCLGMILLVLVLVLENTKYQLNLMVQSTGYYFQWAILQLGFHTDAFGQLTAGEGRATDGQAAHHKFQDWWTVFYMAWWTAWSVFVGLFVARISKGRRISEVVFFGLLAPFLYALIWFCVFGGTGMRQLRQANELELLGETYFDDSGYFLSPGSDTCYAVPQGDVVINGTVIFTNKLPGITPVCQFTYGQGWYDVMYSFSYPGQGVPGFGNFMTILSILALIIYFVTSSDSGSMIVDHLASNGAFDHHWIQRLFWAFTEGAVAIALLIAGGGDALSALQAASIVFGLPINILLLMNCMSIADMCFMSEQKLNKTLQEETLSNTFVMPIFGGIFNIMETLVSFGRVHEDRKRRGMAAPTTFQVSEFFKNLFLPFVGLHKVLGELHPGAMLWNILTVASYAVTHVGWIVFFILTTKSDVFIGLGWTAFLINGCILTSVRQTFRESRDLRGNIFGDFFACSFLFPQVLTQFLVEIDSVLEVPPKGEEVELIDVSVDSGLKV